MTPTVGKQWFGNETSISITYGEITHEIGIAENITIEFTSEDVKLRGCGDIMWQDVGRTNGDIAVTLKYAKIPAIANDIAVFSLNSEGPTTGSIALDTASSSYPKFTLVSVVTSSDGLATRTATLTNVYFPNYTWDSTYSEFTKQELKGSSNNITLVEVST